MTTLPRAEARDLANEVIRMLDGLDGVYINGVSSSARLPVISEPLALENSIHTSGIRDGDQVITISRYNISAETQPDDGTPSATAWTINFDVVAAWHLKADASAISDDALHSFALGMGALTAHPYARSFTQTLTTQMGYPAATMEIIFNPLSGDGDLDFRTTAEPPA